MIITNHKIVALQQGWLNNHLIDFFMLFTRHKKTHMGVLVIQFISYVTKIHLIKILIYIDLNNTL